MAHGGRACACGCGALCAVWGGHVFYFWLCIVGCEHVCMYMMTGWSPGMDDSIDACMHVCVFSVFLLYIIIILLCRFITLGQ